MNRWTVKLYRAADLTTAVASPTLTTHPTFKAEYDEQGDGGVTVQMSDADAALVDVDQILVLRLDGTPIHAVVVEEIDYATVAASKGQRTLTIRGRGALALLEGAIIEPAAGEGHLPVEDVRAFNWTAFDYDDTGPEWVAATEYAAVTAATTFWNGLPIDFPDYGNPDGTSVPKWIGPSTGSTTNAPEGDCYYRRTITTGEILFDLFMAADNYGEAYLDGVLLLTSPGFGITRHIQGGILISAGTHVLAFKTHNYPDDGAPGGNPTGLIYSAVSLTVDGLIGSVLTFSGSLTKICQYPATPPGMTVGAAMKKLIDTAKAAAPARLVGLTYDFTALADSNGVVW